MKKSELIRLSILMTLHPVKNNVSVTSIYLIIYLSTDGYPNIRSYLPEVGR